MLEKINLLPFKRAVSPKEKKIRFWLQLASGTILGLYILALLAFSSYWLFLENKDKALNKKTEALKAQIATHREAETFQRQWINKLENLSEVLEKREEFLEIFNDLEKLTLDGLEFNDLRTGEEGELELKGRAVSSFVLDELVEEVLADKDYQEATMARVARTKEGEFEFELRVKR